MIQYAFTVTLLLDVVIKVSLLLLVFWAGSLTIRKRSAAAQHRWWALGFAGCLLIPAITFVTPTWTLPIFPEAIQSSKAVTVDDTPAGNNQAVTTATASIAQQAPLGQLSLAQQPTTLDGLVNTPDDQSIADAKDSANIQPNIQASTQASTPPTNSTSPVTPFSWTGLLIVIWIIGVATFWLRLVWQHVLIKRLLNDCTRLNDAQWHQLLASCSQSLGLKRNVSLLIHKATHSPVSAGVRHPVVILPEDAASWNLDQRRLVLLHELAHVARQDVLTQTLAGFACGLFWFNPLCWHGLFQMRKLRELACDDLVLNCGQQPSGYADVLLGIARSYQHQNYSTAVGMAHSSNVENRIMAILDKTRRHVSLSRNAARLLLAFAVALVCLVGTAQLRSEAKQVVTEAEQEVESNEAAESDVQDENVQNDLLREMRIRILDDAGAPLEGAMLTASVWYPKGYKGPRTPKEHTADSDGTVVLRIPKRLDIFRLWPSQPGYVGEFKNFAKKTHGEGELIPDEFEFRLSDGHEIGGRIVDAKGNPIEGVQVQVSVDEDEPAWTVNAEPIINMWLTDSSVKTDAQGRWQINNAPGPHSGEADHSFRLKLSHDDYTSDENWGDAQRAQGVSTADLRSGDATIVLQPGTFVHGIVSDLEGNPVKKGWIVWHDEPYFNQGVFETEIKPDGSFRTPPLSSKEYPITVVAPGYAAQRRVVQVDSDLSQLRFQLSPGKRMEIRFVDTAGKPVPKAGVYLANSSYPMTWNGSNALHNHKHPNVPDYGIPRRADASGVYVWDWAPEEPVSYSVSAKGFAAQKVSLVAKSEPHIITLASARVVAGLVTDSVTGEPIKQLQAMPVIVFRPNHFGTRYTDTKPGDNGRYELPLTGSGDPEDRYRVRFEADGYRSVVSEESYGPSDGRAKLNIQLDPAPALEGRAVDAKGNPVSDAQVIVGTPTWVPNTGNGKAQSYGERIVQTDSDGRFALNATSEPVRVRVLHASGIAEKLIDPEDDAIGDLQLQPWASVSGRLVQDGQPVGDQSIYFSPLVRRGLGEARFQDSFSARTSSDGRFVFERLPSGVGSLQARLGPWEDSPLTSSKSLSLELKPGENRKVVLGGEGPVLTGQVVATGRDTAPLDHNWSLNYLISRDRGVEAPYPAGFPKLGFDPSGPMQPAWSLDPHFNEWVATREHHFVKLTPEGKLRVTGVSPGEYDLVIRLYEQPAGCLVETVGEKIVPVRVEDKGEVDLGQIEVPCRAGPRVGSDMRAFKFVDANGSEQLVNDMAGRHVLMHVWASWCGPCLKSMPDMVDMASQLATQPVTFVGLNIDQDSAQATELAQRTGLSWSQNYLGDDSDMARQLAISSAPTYYLIGPDGLLAAYSNEWTKIKEELALLLDEAQK